MMESISKAQLEPAIKAWGRSYPLFLAHDLELVKIEVEYGGFSSIHCHFHKSNMFIVTSGVLQVCTYKTPVEHDYEKIKFLHCYDDAFLILPEIYHSFRALEYTEAYEIYRPYREGVIVDPNDIKRVTQGGLLDLSKSPG